MTTFTHHPRLEKCWAFDPGRTYSQEEAWAKPVGFWLSVDDDWRRWCDDAGMGYASAAPVPFSVDTDACLWLRSVDDIDRFDREYVGGQDVYGIDWVPLTQRYAGIIIAPYQWQRRLGPTARWYYPWDCASACVWDLSAIQVAAPAEVAR